MSPITEQGIRSADGSTWVVVPVGGGEIVVEHATTIGRIPLEAHSIQIADAYISRRHCRVHLDAGRLWIEDLRSANGTEIRRRDGSTTLLEPALRHVLEDGDIVASGDSVLFHVARRDGPHLEMASPSSAALSARPDHASDIEFLEAAAEIGVELIDDPTALRNLVCDLFANNPSAGRAVVAVVEGGGLSRLPATTASSPDLARWAAELRDSAGIDAGLGEWAIELWSTAVRSGVLSRSAQR